MTLTNSCLVTVILASLLSLHKCHYSNQQHAQAPISSTFVKLSNSSNVRILPSISKRNHTSDLSTRQSGDIHQQQHFQQKSLFEKTCIGTSNRMSGQHNKTDHYQNLAERYRNCTYVIGNLEITWLERGQDNKAIDLTFLESIREITGYLLIAYVDVEKISMPNLQIIRGRDLFRLNNGQKEEFAMFLIENELKTLELPNLREILAGSVGSYNNRNLCYLRSINWDEILNMPMYRPVFVYNGTEPECPNCDPSCEASSCWGEGSEMCQKFSKTTCAPQCSQGRCFGRGPRECCHMFCAGGCTGPKQTDCLACKNFYNDGECIQECPSMMRYNPIKYMWEPNPHGKYSFGANCVKECPDHLLRDNGACVRTCPPNKRSVNGDCVPCSGPCPKNCQGVEVVHSGNIDQLINCTVIEGSITILDTSFTGYTDFNSNNTILTKYEPMHPSRLEVFKTLREITGYLNIQANHSDFKNLSCFRNLNTITGRQVTDMSSALSIIKTSLVSLNLRSLRRIKSGRITIEENRDLCFADTIDWSQTNITKREDITSRNNADSARCRQLGLQCHPQCARDGCWGPGPDECLSCKNYMLDDMCVNNCTSTPGILSYDAGGNTCKRCHSECKYGCSGTEALHCLRCKNVKDGPFCVTECPNHKYNNNGICEECDKRCMGGCTGPSNKLGEGGCNSCAGKTVINSTAPTFVAHCIRAEDECPDGYYKEYVGPQADGPFKSSSGKPVCRKCHSNCKKCTGMGTHVSVCTCAKYEVNDQCDDHCGADYYADERRGKCVRCSQECYGCFGPTEVDCLRCRVYRIYQDPNFHPTSNAMLSGQSNTSIGAKERGTQQPKFNCTPQCPPSRPYRIGSNMQDPYCSDQDLDGAGTSWLKTSSLGLVFAVVIGFALCCYKSHMQRNATVKLAQQISGFEDAEPLKPSNMPPNLSELKSIKETELRIGEKLGCGFGGTVYKGLWFPGNQEKKPVAIKVLNDNPQPNPKEFLEEAYIMASANHPNLVKLLAICMTPDSLMLVTQLMPLGGLLEYVKEHENEIRPKDLLEWCKQIAKGMAYLEKNRMVHRDLALRNVLLQRKTKAMISDFGLAKLLEVNQNEYQSGGGRLPIKWLAPECIRHRTFTHKSDVWAFGVTVWELLKFGAKPFEGYEPKDVPGLIEKGERLEKPANVSTEVYKVMLACWFYHPEDRPNFESLAENFSNFARDPERYLLCGHNAIESRSEWGRIIDSNDENVFDEDESRSNSFGENESQDRPIIPDLLAPINTQSRKNEMPAFEMRHHSESEAGNSQHLSTPTIKRIGMFHDSGQPLIEDSKFSTMSARMVTTPLVADNNNNNFIPNGNRLNSNANSCWSVHHTVSTNSLGQRSEQPTDPDDYLLPSPCSTDDKFSKFLAAHGNQSSRLPPAPAFTRDPPHSAGPYGTINNEEYFMTRTNYASSHTGHRENNASSASSHIPLSLV